MHKNLVPPSKEEQVVQAFGVHWIVFLRPTIMCCFALVGSITLFSIAGANAENGSLMLYFVSFFAGLVIFTTLLHWYIHRLLSESMVDIMITTKRVILLRTSLFFRDDIRDYALNRLRAVEGRKRGFLQNLLQYGSLWFDTGGSGFEDPKASIHYVPNPNIIAENITKLLTKERTEIRPAHMVNKKNAPIRR